MSEWTDRATWNHERACWTVKETDTHWIEVVPFLYTAGIVTTPKDETLGYDDRFCYHDTDTAIEAALAWDCDKTYQPDGWHRRILGQVTRARASIYEGENNFENDRR